MSTAAREQLSERETTRVGLGVEERGQAWFQEGGVDQLDPR